MIVVRRIMRHFSDTSPKRQLFLLVFLNSTRTDVKTRLPQSIRNSSSHAPQTAPSVSVSVDTRISQSLRMTKTLILVSTCFLILNAPAHISIIATKLYTNVVESPLLIPPSDNLTSFSSANETFGTGKSNGTASPLALQSATIVDHVGIHLMYITVLLAQYISYASYSINFFLYSFSGVAFRTTVRQTFRKVFQC